MANYYHARQCIEYALQELDGDGEPAERLTRAWIRMEGLGKDSALVPPTIADEVSAMHERVQVWRLPRQTQALETSIAWMSEAECAEAIDAIQRWRRAVDDAITAQIHRGDSE